MLDQHLGSHLVKRVFVDLYEPRLSREQADRRGRGWGSSRNVGNCDRFFSGDGDVDADALSSHGLTRLAYCGCEERLRLRTEVFDALSEVARDRDRLLEAHRRERRLVCFLLGLPLSDV